MQIISETDTLHIICRTLNKIDPRLLDHGERVAYLFYHLLRAKGTYSQRQLFDLCVVALFHDVGAYKTEEIDRMVEFESNETWRHTIYGYVFLKDLTPLSKYADIVLFHHLNYNQFHLVKSDWLEVANLLHLADRADFGLYNNVQDLESLFRKNCCNKQFSEESIELFSKANQKYNLIEKLKSKEYQAELNYIFDLANFSNQTIHEYLKMLAYTIDFRSEQTVAHTITTVKISVETAKRLGLSSREIAKIYYGSLLHDIGKIATPIEILEKSGRLTNDEMKKMKCHVFLTNEILDGYIDDSIRKIAARHHEKMDGSGYPLGLVGKELTISEQVVAVTDIMSALTGNRSYKEAFSKDKTISILTDMRDNNKLSPIVVDAVVTHYDEIMKNANKASERILQTYDNIQMQYRALFNQYRQL